MKSDRHDVLFEGSHPLPSNYRAYRHSVHARLVEILRQNAGCCFLEIGVGSTFRQERFRTINDLGIHYVGLDFERVCAQRRADLAAPASPTETSPLWESVRNIPFQPD